MTETKKSHWNIPETVWHVEKASGALDSEPSDCYGKEAAEKIPNIDMEPSDESARYPKRLGDPEIVVSTIIIEEEVPDPSCSSKSCGTNALHADCNSLVPKKGSIAMIPHSVKGSEPD